MGYIEEIADFASSLQLNVIPLDVLDRLRAQRRSVLASIASSYNDDSARVVLDAVSSWASTGPAPLVFTERKVRVDDALVAASAFSMALDFDDYLSFAHPGHSAVLVPLLLASETGAGADVQLLAQLIADEVEARLGAACILGPLNGQLWSFVHAAGAAAAAAKVLGLNKERTAHALAIALYQPPRPSIPGFISSGTKVLTAVEGIISGLRAARLAAKGMIGPLDILDTPDGLLSSFSYAPFHAALGGLGEYWLTRTLAIKPLPGCAYLTSVIESLLSLGPLDPSTISSIAVDASIFTCAMDTMTIVKPRIAASATSTSRTTTRSTIAGPRIRARAKSLFSKHVHRARHSYHALSPVIVGFSVPWSVAVTIVASSFDPDVLQNSWLADHAEQLGALADKVVLRHDWRMTSQAIGASLMNLPPLGSLLSEVGPYQMLKGLLKVKTDHPTTACTNLHPDIIKDLAIFLIDKERPRITTALPTPARRFRTAMVFPAEVTIQFHNGRRVSAREQVNTGSPDHPDISKRPEQVSQEKLARFGPMGWGETRTALIAKAIAEDDDNLFDLIS